ncbi:hypothetical protein Tco_0569886 [Tanacetum coccineum]
MLRLLFLYEAPQQYKVSCLYFHSFTNSSTNNVGAKSLSVVKGGHIRKASHIAVAVECTLQSHPNMVILAEEVASSKL